jgi:hypothetical protein
MENVKKGDKEEKKKNRKKIKYILEREEAKDDRGTG